MMTTLRCTLAVVSHPYHLKRTCLVALIVGIWLTLFNLGGQLLAGPWNLSLAVKILMNVLTPFVVANLGLLSRKGDSEQAGLAAVLYPQHLKQTAIVALFVGISLSVFNVGGQLLAGPWNLSLAVKILMNVLTPFVVANLGLLSRRTRSEQAASGADTAT
jgi:hypothetical protein